MLNVCEGSLKSEVHGGGVELSEIVEIQGGFRAQQVLSPIPLGQIPENTPACNLVINKCHYRV